MKENKHALQTPWVDPDDAPELTDEWFEQADLYKGNTLLRRGRPDGTANKSQVTLRLDKDVLTAFKETGKGWQTRINDALREWLANHSPSQSL